MARKNIPAPTPEVAADSASDMPGDSAPAKSPSVPRRRAAPRPRADVEETFADIDGIAALTGFAPATPLAQGVPRFAAWFKAWHGLSPADPAQSIS